MTYDSGMVCVSNEQGISGVTPESMQIWGFPSGMVVDNPTKKRKSEDLIIEPKVK